MAQIAFIGRYLVVSTNSRVLFKKEELNTIYYYYYFYTIY